MKLWYDSGQQKSRSNKRKDFYYLKAMIDFIIKFPHTELSFLIIVKITVIHYLFDVWFLIRDQNWGKIYKEPLN